MTRSQLALGIALLYVVAAGHPAAPLAGLPIGLTGLVLLVVVVTLAAWTRAEPDVRSPKAWVVAGLALALAGKIALGLLAAPAGWTARYYGNDAFTPPAERSTDFLHLEGATRIDDAIDFSGTSFPVHFLNHQRFSTGSEREISEPFSVAWSGYVDAGESLRLSLETRGTARLLVDGVEQLTVDGTASVSEARATEPIAAGPHLIEVQYQKPAAMPGLVALRYDSGEGQQALGRSMVTTVPFDGWRRTADSWFAAAAWVLHAVAAFLAASWLLPAVLRRVRHAITTARTSPVAAVDTVAVPLVVLALTAQGVWKARRLVDHVWTLSGGDDWLAYEAQARDVLLHGLLMPLGAEIGQGRPFLYYPAYTYLTAFVHRLTGESLAGVVLVNFVLLALALVIVYRLAQLLTSPAVAVAALAWVFVIAQLDAVRYYTVTLLSENLFWLMVPATVCALCRYVLDPRMRWLVAAGAAGGLASLTRPSIMLFLPPAILIVMAARRNAGFIKAASLGALFFAVWMAVIMPATVRNSIVSGDPVLITAGQAVTFVDYNLPAGDHPQYKAAFTGSIVSAARILLWILVDHPAEMLRHYADKLIFSVGMVHLREGYAVHPELLLTTALYLAAIALVPQARTLAASPMHVFILTHLATLLLTSPWNYGYRMLLAMFLIMPVFAAAAAARVLALRPR